MKKQFFTIVCAASTLLLLQACTAGKSPQNQFSGYLQDYSQVETTKDTNGEPVLRFVSPRLNKENYQKIIIEPVQYFPTPTPNKNVSAQTLENIKAYIDESFKETVQKKVDVVDTPGPGVARMRIALTAVDAQADNLKPYQFVPVALVLTAGHAAVQGRPERATLYLEAETTDSVSGERLAIAVREGSGERLPKMSDDRIVTLESVKPVLDSWFEAYGDFLSKKL